MAIAGRTDEIEDMYPIMLPYHQELLEVFMARYLDFYEETILVISLDKLIKRKNALN